VGSCNVRYFCKSMEVAGNTMGGRGHREKKRRDKKETWVGG
jgi:hypothetical protein